MWKYYLFEKLDSDFSEVLCTLLQSCGGGVRVRKFPPIGDVILFNCGDEQFRTLKSTEPIGGIGVRQIFDNNGSNIYKK